MGSADKLAGSGAAPRTTGLAVQRVGFDRPWEWLAAGWRDMWNRPLISLAYGLIATLVGLVLAVVLAWTGLEALIPVLAGGFLLLGPLMAVGLYEKSRLLAAGEAPTFSGTLGTAWRSMGRFGFLAAGLMLVYFLWVRIAFLLLALFLGTRGLPPAKEFMPTLLFTQHGLSLLVVGTAIGGVLAAIVFATTAISLPLLSDRERHVDSATAVGTSVESVLVNPKPMALWAALIAGFVALGLLTLGAGLIFVFPLVGHATWHAYRDLIKAT